MRTASIKTAAKPPPPPSEPFESSEPSEPSESGPVHLKNLFHNPFPQPAAPAAPLRAQRALNPFEPLVPLCYDGCILFKGDENVNIKLVLLGLLALFSLYRLYEHNDFMTLCATVIVVAAFVLSALHLWRRRE